MAFSLNQEIKFDAKSKKKIKLIAVAVVVIIVLLFVFQGLFSAYEADREELLRHAGDGGALIASKDAYQSYLNDYLVTEENAMRSLWYGVSIGTTSARWVGFNNWKSSLAYQDAMLMNLESALNDFSMIQDQFGSSMGNITNRDLSPSEKLNQEATEFKRTAETVLLNLRLENSRLLSEMNNYNPGIDWESLCNIASNHHIKIVDLMSRYYPASYSFDDAASEFLYIYY